MNGESRFHGDNLDSILGSLSSEARTSNVGADSDDDEYYDGEMFRHRFYGDNLDSLLGSVSSDDGPLPGWDWADEQMSRPSTPVTDITIPNTPDTVGEYPNVISASISAAPKSTENSPTQSVALGNTEQISFDLGNFPSNTHLENLYPEQIERHFALMTRDLQVVAYRHMLAITAMGPLEMPLSLSTSPQHMLRPQSIPHSLGVVINQLSSLKDMATNNLVGIAGELQGTRTSNTSPWQHWPSNTNGVHLTKLLGTFTGMSPTVQVEQTEIVDYCIADHPLMDHRELLFHDGSKVKAERWQMLSIEQGEVCNPAIVSAWGRILQHRRKISGLPIAACLDVVDKVETAPGDGTMVYHWEDWLESGQIDIHTADLVFIPVKMRNHYTLIAINFNKRTIHSIDGVFHSDQPAWDIMAHSVSHQVGRLLDRIKHKHAKDLQQFRYQLVNPKWTTNDERTDSAIEVMHLMDVYDGNPSSMGNMPLNEPKVRVALKIAYVADIVTSKVSVCREEVLGKIPGFIEAKCNDHLRPSREVVQFRQVCGWLADA